MCRGGHPCSFSSDLSIPCQVRRKSTAWESKRTQVQLSAQETGWVPCINIAAVNLTVKAECELSWTWFKQDIEVKSMEMFASCKSLVENGVMVRLTAHSAPQSRLKQRPCFWWYRNLDACNPRLQASKHWDQILSDLLSLPSEQLLARVKNSM